MPRNERKLFVFPSVFEYIDYILCLDRIRHQRDPTFIHSSLLLLLGCAYVRYYGPSQYSLMHRCRVLLTSLWAERAVQEGAHILANCVHPGWVDTPGLANAKDMSGFYACMRPFLRTEAEGADTALWLAMAPKQSVSSITLSHGRQLRTSGRFYYDRTVHDIDLPCAGTESSTEDVADMEKMIQAVFKRST
jgi:hypothetical protein